MIILLSPYRSLAAGKYRSGNKTIYRYKELLYALCASIVAAFADSKNFNPHWTSTTIIDMAGVYLQTRPVEMSAKKIPCVQ